MLLGSMTIPFPLIWQNLQGEQIWDFNLNYCESKDLALKVAVNTHPDSFDQLCS